MSTDDENPPTAEVDIPMTDILDNLSRRPPPREAEVFPDLGTMPPTSASPTPHLHWVQRIIMSHLAEVARLRGVNLFEAAFECQVVFEGGTTAVGMIRTTDDPFVYCITSQIVGPDQRPVAGMVAEHYFHVSSVTRFIVPKQAPQQGPKIWSPNANH